MGVGGLKKYEEMALKTSKSSSVVELAQKYRKEHNRRPVLLIDGTNFLFETYSKAISSPLLGGGEIKTATSVGIKFLLNLRENDIDFVLFFDESTPDDRLRISLMRAQKAYEGSCEIFRMLEKGSYDYSVGIYCMEAYQFYFKNYLIALGAHFIVSDREADDEIMKYVALHGCFGVLSNDTDFMVGEGIPYVFELNNFNYYNLTATHTNYKKLAAALQIPLALLPYFATLCGNDIVMREDLRQFHLSLLKNHRWNKNFRRMEHLPAMALLPEVINWLRLNAPLTETLPENLPENLARDIRLPHLAANIQRSVDSYTVKTFTANPSTEQKQWSPSKKWNSVIDQALDRTKRGLMHYAVCQIMINLKFFCTGTLQILNKPSYPNEASIAKQLFLRLFGFLLAERPQSLGPAVIKGWILDAKNSLNAPQYLVPHFPCNKYDLTTYWSPSCPNLVKWEMLCWIIDPELNVEQVMKLPRVLCVPTLVVYLINKAKPNKEAAWAVNALVVQAALLLTATLTDIANASCGPPMCEILHYATVFSRLCEDIYVAAQTCGSPVSLCQHPDVPFFDMRLYNETCFKIRSGQTGLGIIENRKSLIVTEGYINMLKFLDNHR